MSKERLSKLAGLLILTVRSAALCSLLCIFLTTVAACQTSPSDLARTVLQRWSGSSLGEFDAVYPFPQGRELFSDTLDAQFDRTQGLGGVLSTRGSEATLLISGVPIMDNSGDSTSEGRVFSGIYEAREEGGTWSLSRQVPLEEQGQILSQKLAVQVRPADGIDVQDEMQIRVKTQNGFAMRLNYRAQLRSVQANNLQAKYQFGGGLLWVDLPPGPTVIRLEYSIAVEEGPNETNSGAFLRQAGHIRNQYFWHPFFDFGSAGDQATFEIKATIPSAYSLSTSLPQNESIVGGNRVVVARTIRPTFALSLTYDRNWQIVNEPVGPLNLELFLSPTFKPAPQSVVKEFRSVYTLLSDRFGTPDAMYFGVVQDQSIAGNGWLFASNQVVVAGGWPRVFSRSEGFPRAFFGHEIGHLWTNGAGPAANFLGEGWATYVESLVLGQEYETATVRRFWRQEAESYFQEQEGKASILTDNSNSGVSYSKGAWIFHMLSGILGEEAFDRGMMEYSRRSLKQAAGWEILADCLQKQTSTVDVHTFLKPWLSEKTAPVVTVKMEAQKAVIHQTSPFFNLPITLEGKTAGGSERQTIWIHGEDTPITFKEKVSDLKVDPEEMLLLKR